MSEIKEALWRDYNEAKDRLNEVSVDSSEYQTILGEKDKLRKELIELEQIEQEKSIKISQIESENKREKIRNGITIGTFAISTGVSLYAIARTFKFDQSATVTSTLGRNILNGVVPKMLKR